MEQAGMVPLKQARSWPGRSLWAGSLTGLLCASMAAVAAPLSSPSPRPEAQNSTSARLSGRILVEPLGFVPPARFFMPYRVPSATLDFLDATHLLFTFHAAKLMRREVDDPKDDQDQTVRALVLSVPGGKIEAEGTWRLHDRGRYLWMLGDGRFLMRQRDTLYLGDKSLGLTLYLHPEGTFVSGQLSPDGSTLLAQYVNPVSEDDAEAAGGRPAGAPTLGPSPNGSSPPGSNSSLGDEFAHFPAKPKQYTMLVINTRARTATRLGHLPQAYVFPMVQGGYLGVEQGKGKQWNLLLSSFGGTPVTIATINSSCQPVLAPLSEQTFLAQTCLPMVSDHLMQAYDLKGHKLWEQLWQSRFTWGTYAYASLGNRFGYGSVEINHNLATLDPVGEADVLGQPVGIFSVATGKLDVVLDANPILTAGDNFALSPQGDKLAILRNGAIELYDLPPLALPGGAQTAMQNSVMDTAKHP